MFYVLLGERKDRKTQNLGIVIRNTVRGLNFRAQRSASSHDVLEPPEKHEGKQPGAGGQSFGRRCMADVGKGVRTQVSLPLPRNLQVSAKPSKVVLLFWSDG